ncbi:hypothetical protein FISHEDRAFT_72939 [Fistulina hepatica ATCC 64428]|uniref:DUF6593 domain-containing protein n=1 Tax=Fistulina hepatica ATCC 64428 TaxID=1128425 RepID=A0A0D7AEI7_9AGAR|nr:hypothetical protein FISHEDRAFT_72939 [Fistulina hepatica ATCC 64428]
MAAPPAANAAGHLRQVDLNPFRAKYENSDGLTAFEMTQAVASPNVVMMLCRNEKWTALHPEIKGPSKVFFYFGPELSPGYVAFGNNRETVSMRQFLRKADKGRSRLFTALNGKLFTWHYADDHNLICFDDRRQIIAKWCRSVHDQAADAALVLFPAAMPVVDEVLVALSLNRMAGTFSFASYEDKFLGWVDV